MNSPRSSPRPIISLLHATRGRPDLALAARDQWIKAATYPERVEHIFAVDCDDEPTQQAVASLLHRIVPQKGGGCVAAWNLAAEASTGDVLVQLSDDWTPVPGWDEEFVRRLRDVSQPAVLRPSDGHRRDDLLCMAILTRARLLQQGEFLHSGYLGVFSDDEFSFRAYLDGVVIDARDLVLTHHHPFYDTSVVHDETYANQNNATRTNSGRDLFLRRHPQAMGHWLHKDTWERFFVPLAAHAEPEKAEAPQKDATPAAAIAAVHAQQKTLRVAQDLFLNKKEHVELFRSTALQAKGLLEGIRKSILGGRVLQKEQLQPFRKCLEGAKLRQKRRSMLDACSSYVQATRIGLDLLKDVGRHFLVKSKSLSASIEHLRSQYRSQRNWLRKIKRWSGDLPGVKNEIPWGFDPTYYAQQSGKTFDAIIKAVRHYAKEGWQKGLNPHSLIDTRYFQTQNAAQIDPQANPLEEYHRLLDEGDAPQAHPQFPAAWLREFFTHTYDPSSKTVVAAIPDSPVNLEGAQAFAALKPVLTVGLVLFRSSEADLREFLLAFAQATRRTVEMGNAPPRLLVTDRSLEWNAQSIQQLATSTGVQLHFAPLGQKESFAQAHNELLKAAFVSAETTHILCLDTNHCLHPDALAELSKAVSKAGLPALMEGRQFPQENPKEYDAETLETNWCSAGCLVIPRFLFDLTGGFDTDFTAQCADVDLSWRVWQQGYRCLMTPSALVHSRSLEVMADPLLDKTLLESGRILGEKWRAPKFRLECERKLVECGHCPGIHELAPFKIGIRHEPHGRVDFSHEFRFAQPRW